MAKFDDKKPPLGLIPPEALIIGINGKASKFFIVDVRINIMPTK